ncbi:MAG: GIY-YIG nuclease family protein [Salinibacter sp.]|uniref:GIY-YIG nuclease family protein n=1 Tax=Salinibacter sp. TaxID=2065818 RepID=UPI0035D45429
MAPSPSDNAAPHGRHYVYVVECSDGTYYTGYTTDVERRVDEHNDGSGAKYTRGRRPVELVHVETYDTQSDAMQREHAIKQLRRAAKEQLVRDGEAGRRPSRDPTDPD